MVRLISFDIDGTLEVGDPPGLVTLEAVRQAHALGFFVGSCSDRTLSNQKSLWEEHELPMHFTVLKQGLEGLRSEFDAEHYLHIGDSAIDRVMADRAGFDFVHAIDDDVEAFLEQHIR